MTHNTTKSILHFIAMIFSIVGLVLLIVFASRIGTAWHVVSFSLFGASLIILYLISAIHHLIPHENSAKNLFARLDRSMIYILIAGTYTPLMLIPIQGALGITAVSIIWTLALIGIALYVISPNLTWRVTMILFFFIVALDMTTFFPVKAVLSKEGFIWLIAGSISYGLGILVFGASHFSLARYFPKLVGYDISHYFIIAGSAAHFILMFNYVMYL